PLGAGRRRVLARGGGRRGARVPRRAPLPQSRRGKANTRDLSPLVNVVVVAEFYPSRRDPVLGVWAHRQALAARDAGAEVRVLVLHRLIPRRGGALQARAAGRVRARRRRLLHG